MIPSRGSDEVATGDSAGAVRLVTANGSRKSRCAGMVRMGLHAREAVMIPELLRTA